MALQLERFDALLPGDVQQREHRLGLVEARERASINLIGMPDGLARWLQYAILDTVAEHLYRAAPTEDVVMARKLCLRLAQAAVLAERIEERVAKPSAADPKSEGGAV